MSTIRRGRLFFDTKQWERDGLTSDVALREAHDRAATALSIAESTIPRDDNTWADSLSVSFGIKDREGMRAVATLRSSDPTASYKELGHVVEGRKRKGERSLRGGKNGPLRRGYVYRFVQGSHTMTKAMRAATGAGGQVRTRGRS